jgi:hypothetical protein
VENRAQIIYSIISYSLKEKRNLLTKPLALEYVAEKKEEIYDTVFVIPLDILREKRKMKIE